MKIGFVTLGCDKNTVDTERYLAQVVGRGAEYTADLGEAEVIIVNTCGFIDAAKRESLDALVDAGRMKDEGRCRAVVGVGCMVERHKAELIPELPEIDLFLGSSEMDRLLPELEERGLLGEPIEMHPGERIFTGDAPHVRYLKISEGCDHGCAFCAIPLMRGKHRSFSLAEVVREAQLLELQGAREVNLVAQDLAHYGRDLRNGTGLAEMLEALIAETSIPWFRMLYLYSSGITPRLLEVLSNQPRIVPYLDIPIQHGSDAVLQRMRRPERAASIRNRVAAVRDAVADLAIRTTCIVGFPGETDDDFDRLLDLLEETRFDRVGAFTYSPQEGTKAFDMPDDVPESVKRERLERLLEVQRGITAERCEARLGSIARAMIMRPGTPDSPAEARLTSQADDIDGSTRVAGAAGIAPAGTLVDVRLDELVDDLDYEATLVRVTDMPPAPMRASGRRLPMMADTIGSFGR